MNNPDPSLLSAIWRYRWLTVVVTALAVALGLVYHMVRPQDDVFEASSTVVVQEPPTSAEGTAPQSDSVQFVRSQLEIMRSPVVAEAASEALASDGVDYDGDDVTDAISIVGSVDSPLVTIVAAAPTAEAAAAVANAVADGYREVSQRQATATTEAQLARIDAQVDAINQRLDEIDEELSALISQNAALSSLQEVAQGAAGVIAELQIELLEADGEEADAIRQSIEDHRAAIAAYEELATATTGNPEQAALLQEQSGQVERRALLLIRRDEIAVDASLVPDAVALVQRAVAAERLEGLGLSRVLAVALILGLAAGAGLAYYFAQWRRTFTVRTEPEAVIRAPLLSDVPDFEDEHLDTAVPVRDYPRSAAAEAYRFVSATTEAGARAKNVRSIFVVSATIGHGKTTTAVNLAMAAAVHGRSVLVVDCDFGNQAATGLIAGDELVPAPGLTDVVEGSSTLADSIQRHELGNGAAISLISRGTRPALATAVLQSTAARQLITGLADSFDLVVIDGPPLLQVAYSSILAELAEGLVVVVEHGSRHSELVDLRGRLDLIGTQLLGYVYNRSPLRREMTITEGSMMDILGDSGFVANTTKRSTVR